MLPNNAHEEETLLLKWNITVGAEDMLMREKQGLGYKEDFAKECDLPPPMVSVPGSTILAEPHLTPRCPHN